MCICFFSSTRIFQDFNPSISDNVTGGPPNPHLCWLPPQPLEHPFWLDVSSVTQGETTSRRVMASVVKMMHRKRRFRSYGIILYTLGFQRPLLYDVYFPVKTICFTKDFQVTHPGEKLSLRTCRVQVLLLQFQGVPNENECPSLQLLQLPIRSNRETLAQLIENVCRLIPSFTAVI